LAGTKLYCLVTEAHGCEQLAQSCYSVADWPGVELATFRSRANTLTTEPPSHPRSHKPQTDTQSNENIIPTIHSVHTSSSTDLSTSEWLKTSTAELMSTLVASEVHAATLSQRVPTLALWTFCTHYVRNTIISY